MLPHAAAVAIFAFVDEALEALEQLSGELVAGGAAAEVFRARANAQLQEGSDVGKIVVKETNTHED
jgi:hypothetical protein